MKEKGQRRERNREETEQRRDEVVTEKLRENEAE